VMEISTMITVEGDFNAHRRGRGIPGIQTVVLHGSQKLGPLGKTLWIPHFQHLVYAIIVTG